MLSVPVHTTITLQSNKSRTVTRVCFTVKPILRWVMIPPLGKSFFQFLLTEKIILELLPSVVITLSFCHYCDQFIRHMAQSRSYILIPILVSLFMDFHTLDVSVMINRDHQIHGSHPSSVALLLTKLPSTMELISIGPVKKG